VHAQCNPLNSVVDAKQQSDGVLLKMQRGTLRLQICSNAIVRVRFALSDSIPESTSYVVTKTNWPRNGRCNRAKDVVLTTARMRIVMGKKDGTILFGNSAGKKLLQDYDKIVDAIGSGR